MRRKVRLQACPEEPLPECVAPRCLVWPSGEGSTATREEGGSPRRGLSWALQGAPCRREMERGCRPCRGWSPGPGLPISVPALCPARPASCRGAGGRLRGWLALCLLWRNTHASNLPFEPFSGVWLRGIKCVQCRAAVPTLRLAQLTLCPQWTPAHMSPPRPPTPTTYLPCLGLRSCTALMEVGSQGPCPSVAGPLHGAQCHPGLSAR